MSTEYFLFISLEVSVPFRKMLPKFPILFPIPKEKLLHNVNRPEGEATLGFNTVTDR